MTHAEFLRQLDPTTRARLTRRAPWRGMVHLAGHLGALSLTGAWIMAGWPLWPVVLPVHGVLLVFLFTLQHECTHKTPFAHDWLSEVMGTVIGALLLNPFTWFRYFHLAHHRHTNLPGDPELEGGKPATRAQWVWHVSGLPTLGAGVRLIVRLALGRENPAYLPDRAARRARLEARGLVAVYALALASLLYNPAVFWVWIVPALLGQPFLRLYLLAEHGDCPQVADMFDNTRTTLTGRAIRLLAWNMPYHTEHHSVPSVPFHNLPALHALMRGHLRVTADGYIAFTRAYLARRAPDVAP